MSILNLRHEWPEPAGFTLSRPKGLDNYTVLLFYNSVELQCGDGSLVTAPGAMLIYPPEVPQWFYSREPLLHDWMHLSADEAEALASFGVPLNTVFYPKDRAALHGLFREMELEFYGDKPYRETLLRQKLTELLVRLHRDRYCETAVPLPEEEMTQLRALRRQLLLYPQRPWTVPEMARLTGLSVSRFYTVYKTAFGSSPMDTCIHARITAAQDRLVSTTQTVKEIALSLGYGNVCHFSRQFKSVTGKTPLEYRAQYR